MDNYVYCAADENNNIVEVDEYFLRGSSREVTYFKNYKYLKGIIGRHNELYPEDEWHIVRFKLIEEPERGNYNDFTWF